MSAYISLIIDTLNHDTSVNNILDATSRIQELVETRLKGTGFYLIPSLIRIKPFKLPRFPWLARWEYNNVELQQVQTPDRWICSGRMPAFFSKNQFAAQRSSWYFCSPSSVTPSFRHNLRSFFLWVLLQKLLCHIAAYFITALDRLMVRSAPRYLKVYSPSPAFLYCHLTDPCNRSFPAGMRGCMIFFGITEK